MHESGAMRVCGGSVEVQCDGTVERGRRCGGGDGAGAGGGSVEGGGGGAGAAQGRRMWLCAGGARLGRRG
jgi:hypothetical protein